MKKKWISLIIIILGVSVIMAVVLVNMPENGKVTPCSRQVPFGDYMQGAMVELIFPISEYWNNNTGETFEPGKFII